MSRYVFNLIQKNEYASVYAIAIDSTIFLLNNMPKIVYYCILNLTK